MRQALLLVSVLSVLPAVAQEEADETAASLHRVELIIFANRDPEAAASEAWPPEPALAYPARWQILGSGDTRQPVDREYRLLRVEDTAPEIFDLFWNRSVDELRSEYRQKRQRRADIAREPLYSPDVPRTMVRLPAEQRELNTQRRRIDNSAGLDVLFHESWLQRMRGEEESLPILFDTPERIGDFPELQGSILLYRGRYLHIVTDLWLNTNGQYLDAPESWQMAAPPPPPDPAETPLRPFRVDPPYNWLETAQPRWRGDRNTLEERDDADDHPVTASLSQNSQPPREVVRFPGDAEVRSAKAYGSPVTAARDRSIDTFLAEPAVDYDFRHAVVLRQQRRMRSGELHYIDHPMLGIVIKISRTELEPFVNSAEIDQTPAE